MANEIPKSASPRRRARRIVFWIIVSLASLFLVGVLLPAYPLIVINWFPTDVWLAVRPDRAEGDVAHRLHSLALGMIAWSMLLGIVVQVRRPESKLSAVLGALTVPIALAISEMMVGTYTFTGTAPFFILILAVVLLHPASGEIARRPRWNLPMLGLTAVAAPAWMAYAVGLWDSARHVEPGFEVEHLTFMGAIAMLVALWGIIGSTKHPGWQYAAGASLLATACVALQSVFFPGALSALPLPWASAALAWCWVYGGLATHRVSAD